MLVAKALHFAATKHKKQKRKGSGLPYIVHPVLVMYLLTKYKGNSKNVEALICAALLHDTIEDTDCTYAELEREFGPLVASLVMELTSDEEEIERIGKTAYLKKKLVGMSSYAFTLKLLDRLANVSDNPSDKYLESTLEILKHVNKNREYISDLQYRIMEDIRTVCREGLGMDEQLENTIH